jgi:hypothetical protein
MTTSALILRSDPQDRVSRDVSENAGSVLRDAATRLLRTRAEVLPSFGTALVIRQGIPI